MRRKFQVSCVDSFVVVVGLVWFGLAFVGMGGHVLFVLCIPVFSCVYSFNGTIFAYGQTVRCDTTRKHLPGVSESFRLHDSIFVYVVCSEVGFEGSCVVSFCWL